MASECVIERINYKNNDSYNSSRFAQIRTPTEQKSCTTDCVLFFSYILFQWYFLLSDVDLWASN